MTDDYDYGEDEGKGWDPDLSPTPRDYANLLLTPIDLDMQLVAIRSLLRRERAEKERLSAELRAIERRARSLAGIANQRAVDDCGEAFLATVYGDGTHALAALGMVAPLIESVLVRLFRYLPTMAAPKTPRHRRWDVPDSDLNKWSCKKRLEDEKKWKDDDEKKWKDDLLGGLDQIAKMLDIDALLRQDDLRRLKALFTYRNQMLHNGMEWPEEKASVFDSFAKARPGWFARAEIGERPWMFYMTEAFTDDCLLLLERFVDAVGSLFMRTSLSYDDLRKRAPSIARV